MSSTMVMTADYDMMVSQSPPIYGYSPPAGFLTDYCNTTYDTHSHITKADKRCTPNDPRVGYRPVKSNIRSNSFDRVDKLLSPLPRVPSAKPKRSCLVQRSVSDLTGLLEGKKLMEEEQCHVTSPNKNKKKVVFADDRGMSLTQIRVMSEPSCMPPMWSLRFLSQLTNDFLLDNAEPWEIQFAQPASDYLEFSTRLDTKCVSLENVVVKEKEDCIIGTVKVKNIAFEKTVFIRTTTDGWKTQEDVYATFVQNRLVTPPTTAIYVVYDTFSFKITLPPKNRRIEFCVCFQCDNREFWDNNNGANYTIVKRVAPEFKKALSLNDLNRHAVKNSARSSLQKSMTDAMQTKIDAWSEFASWNHLDITAPYW